MSRLRLAVLLATSLLLNACGGGGGGTTSGNDNPGGNGATPATPGIALLAGALGGPGNLDGKGAQARLGNAEWINGVDRAGTIYLANGLRTITPDGVVTTASEGGTGQQYRGQMAFDAAGNLFQMKGATLWKTSPTGLTTALAGGDVGYADGIGNAAKFQGPHNLAVDAAGNVYLVDGIANVIRKVTPTGVVTTFAGTAGTAGMTDGVGTAAQFYGPSSLATDAAGNVYVGDKGNFTIRKISPVGVVTTFAGMPGEMGSSDGKGSAARFGSILSMTSDAAGNLYASAEGYCTLRKITLDGTVTTLAGTAWLCSHADGVGAAARFGSHMGIAADAGGNIFVMDQANFVVRKVNPSAVVTTLAGSPPHPGNTDAEGTEARLNTNPIEGTLAVDGGGNIYFAGTNGIRKLSSAGAVSSLPGSAGSYHPGIAADAAGNVYVPSFAPKEIRKISPDGTVTILPGTSGMGAVAVTVDSAGNVYAADNDNGTIRKVSPGGVVTQFVAWSDLGPSFGEGCGYNRMFLTVDAAGNIYASQHKLVFKITPSGAVTLLAGAAANSCRQWGAVAPPGSMVDGVGSNARFNSIGGLAADVAGSVYLTDTNTVRKISPVGVVTTIVGKTSSVGVILGPLPGSLNSPTGIAILPGTSGNKLVVMDEYSLLSITLQ